MQNWRQTRHIACAPIDDSKVPKGDLAAVPSESGSGSASGLPMRQHRTARGTVPPPARGSSVAPPQLSPPTVPGVAAHTDPMMRRRGTRSTDGINYG